MEEIKVVAHKPEWKQEFDKEAQQLNNILGALALNIHHIGSTSVPNLVAKPIIDILLETSSVNDLDAQAIGMESLGYEVMGEFGIPGRRYFRKSKELRTHHVHCFESGDDNLIRHLAFRDYLIEHKEIADAYGNLKSEIVKTCNNDMGIYCDAKDPFIALHEPKALAWYNQKKNLTNN